MTDEPCKADWQKAVAETNRLQRELDITNADHIALWIEANTIPDEPMNQCASWLACRIVEAHEKAQATRIEALEAALRKVIAYDQLLRKIGEIQPGYLLGGEMPKVDAAYDDMVKTCVNTLSGKALEGKAHD